MPTPDKLEKHSKKIRHGFTRIKNGLARIIFIIKSIELFHASF